METLSIAFAFVIIIFSSEFVLDSCLVSDIVNFEQNFVRLIKDSEFCEKIIKNSNKQLESDFTNIGNSAENILMEISKI